MLWACCWMPALPLEIFDPAEGPRVVYDGIQQRSWVHAANPLAQAAGVRAGQSLATARALCSGLEALRRDLHAETSRLQTLAAIAYGCSSQVVLEPPDALLLEVRSSLRLFGGWPAIRQHLSVQIGALGHGVRIALAPTPLAARLLVEHREKVAIADLARLAACLATVPIDQARLEPAAETLLKAVGVRQLGEARALPAAALARRAGKELLLHLQRLYGPLADPRPLWQPPKCFAQRYEFEYGIESAQALGFPLQRLTRELSRHLQARDAAVQRFELQFGHHDASVSRLPIGLRTPQHHADALFEAARGRLETFELVSSTHWLALYAADLPPFSPLSADLFEGRTRGALDWDGLVERLCAKLGDAAVTAVTSHPDHRPEYAWRRVDISAVSPAPPAAQPPRPMWLLPQPEPLNLPVAQFLGECERIESGWWDGEDVRRDYVVAELVNGQRAWLYCSAGQDGPWMVHGWFA